MAEDGMKVIFLQGHIFQDDGSTYCQLLFLPRRREVL